MPDRETILKMEAGSEFNALIATEVMGWNEWDGEGDCEGPFPMFCRWGNSLAFYESSGEPTISDWSPSTDIVAAWEVLTSLVKPGYYNELSYHHNGENLDEPNLRAFVSMSLRDGYCVYASAPTAPLAICRAILLTTLKAKETQT